MRLRLAFALVAAAGCAATLNVCVGCAAAPPAVSPRAPRALAPGDYVVYRITAKGAAATTITEQILAREGDRVAVLVTIDAGRARRFVEVMRDLPESRAKNDALAVYLVQGDGALSRVPADADTMALLYEGAYVVARGEPRGASLARCDTEIRGTVYACTCATAIHELANGRAQSEDRVCDAFPWTRGPSRWTDPTTGDEVWRADVVEVGNGRQADVPAPPLGDPAR